MVKMTKMPLQARWHLRLLQAGDQYQTSSTPVYVTLRPHLLKTREVHHASATQPRK